jgi:glycosyltransferase involved in cell wall biosynthesis
MIIGHYGHDIWAQGGVSSYIGRVSRMQRELGHTVHLFSCTSLDESEIVDKTINIVKEEEICDRALDFNLDVLHVHCTLRQKQPHSLAIVRTLHGHSPYCPSGSKFLASSGKPCDRAYSLHGCISGHLSERCGSIRPHQMLNNFRHTWNEMKTLKDVPVIAVSHFLRAQMIQTGYLPDNIYVLHLTAPDVQNVQALEENKIPRFLYLGRITSNKGVAWLLRSFKLLNCDAYLDIAGEGDDYAQITDLASQLGIAKRVIFHGWVSSSKAQQLIQDARAVIIPSVWHEPGGTVAFEAMMNSRPVISSCVGGMPEVIHHEENGLLVTPNDVSALAQAMEKLADNPREAVKMGSIGYEIAVERFNLRYHVMHLSEIYQKVRELIQSDKVLLL